jgi:transposase
MALRRKRIIEMLREGFSQSDICAALHCSKRDVSRLAKMLKDIDIGDDALAALSETELRQLASPRSEREDNYVRPDLDYICAELRKPKVTRKLLWYEYGSTTVPDGMQLYQYSQFCKLIESRLNADGAVMRIRHEPARCVFVDWAGDVLHVRDRIVGANLKVYLFVASLPYSGYTYAEGFFDLTQRSWLLAHEHAFESFGGVPYILVPDRCATAVDRSPIYVTKVNSTYMDFAEHYSTAVVPARVRRPRDKSVVEGSVGICEQWVIAALRNQVFFSLASLNEAILARVDWINERPFKEREGCRSSVFEEERPRLKELPHTRYEHFEMKKAKVSHDYHIQVDYMRYSVDYHLIGQWVDVRVSDSTVRVYHGGVLAAEHTRLYGRRSQFSTLREHMPPNHQHYDSAWSPERFTKWAENIGPATSAVIAAVLGSRPIVEQTFVSCANILGLAKKGRSKLLEAACGRVAGNGVVATSYTQVRNLMEAIRKAEDVLAGDEDVVEGGAADPIGRTRGAEYYRRHRDGDGDGSGR